MYNILITEQLEQAGLDRLDAMPDMQYDIKTGLDKTALTAVIADYDSVIMRNETQLDADLIYAASKLKVIGRSGAGIDNIDLTAATQRGIIVTNTPHANSVTTAEHTMALMLATSRHIPRAHNSLLEGRWDRAPHKGMELQQKVLGIIGFGQIGRLVAKRAQAFDMKVIAYDPYVSEAIGRDLEIELVDFDDLLSQSDYVTLHCAATAETINLINKNVISKMKHGVVIINVARGKLVDEEALAHALKSGQIGAAGIDVFVQEPLIHSPLINLPNVVHTPHLGGFTQEAQQKMSIEVIEQVVDVLRDTDIRHAVNVSYPTNVAYEDIQSYTSLAEKIGRVLHHMSDGEIHKVQVEVTGAELEDCVKIIASGLLEGVLADRIEGVNHINAPLMAQQHGVAISQEYDMSQIDYSNLITCRAYWTEADGSEGTRTVAGVLFGGSEPRLVQIDRYRLEAKPEGYVIAMRNKDTPGVIGQVATLLATYEVNIAEWRLGRDEPGGEAICFINVDKEPPTAVLDALAQARAITKVKLIKL